MFRPDLGDHTAIGNRWWEGIAEVARRGVDECGESAVVGELVISAPLPCKVAPGSIVTLGGDSTVVSTTRGAGAGHGELQSENTPSMAAGCKLGSPNVALTLTRAGHLHVPSTLYM